MPEVEVQKVETIKSNLEFEPYEEAKGSFADDEDDREDPFGSDDSDDSDDFEIAR